MTNVQSPKNTLVTALPSGAADMYPTEFAAVVKALTERDYALTDQITDVVVHQFRVPRETVRANLSMAGMEVRPDPVPVVVEAPDMSAFEEALTSLAPAKKAKKGKKSEVAKLAKVVNKLVKAARRNGISI